MRTLKPRSERPAVLHQLDFDNVDVEGRRPVRRSGSAIPHSREDVIACECIPDLLRMHDLSLEVDGIPMAGLEDGNLHYLNFIEDGGDLIVPIWLADGTEQETAGYEFSVILTPLAPGEHVVQLKGKWSDEFDSFESDVTYYITVVPGKRK